MLNPQKWVQNDKTRNVRLNMFSVWAKSTCSISQCPLYITPSSHMRAGMRVRAPTHARTRTHTHTFIQKYVFLNLSQHSQMLYLQCYKPCCCCPSSMWLRLQLPASGGGTPFWWYETERTSPPVMQLQLCTKRYTLGLPYWYKLHRAPHVIKINKTS